MFIPEEYASANEDSTEVEFNNDIITGVKFSVVPVGSDTIVEPYWFNIPVELKLVYKKDLLDSLGVDPMDLDVFFADNTGFVPVNNQIAMVDTARNRIYASIGHFSTLVVKSGESKTGVKDVIPQETPAFTVYPNPFSTQSVIEFKLEQAAHINLSIYNSFGQKIKVLANDDFNNGIHRFVWKGDTTNGSKASAGIYLVRMIQNRETTNVQRLVLSR
ncbi:MAG: T9SS type A sorting domain-containing protein [Draconibacterium sp.]